MFLDRLKHSYFACLSILILAICSLLLPIEGYCGWSYMDEGYSSFSDSSYESHGGGWTLSGSVTAASCCASASMGPSIENPTAFDGPYGIRVADYTGSATAEASREEVTVWYSYPSMGSFHYYSQQVTFEAKADYGNGSFLQAWVLMVEKEVEMVTGVLLTDSKKTLIIEVPLGDGRAKKGATWESGGKQYKTEFHEKIKKIVPQAQSSESVNAYVSGRAEANKSGRCLLFFLCWQ